MNLVPDVGSPEFASEAHRQSALVAALSDTRTAQDFIDAISADLWNEG